MHEAIMKLIKSETDRYLDEQDGQITVHEFCEENGYRRLTRINIEAELKERIGRGSVATLGNRSEVFVWADWMDRGGYDDESY